MVAKKKSIPPHKAFSLLEAPAPTETISATIPKNILDMARKTVGKRGLSAFIAGAMRRELVYQNRLTLAKELEAEWGPPDDAEVARLQRVLSE